jgi:putative ABC transport system permease protein
MARFDSDRHLPFMGTSTLHRLRVAARTLARSPSFTIAAVATLALGIGLSTAVFTIANTLLLRRLPVRDEARIVLLWGDKPGDPIRFPMSVATSRKFARESRALEQVAFTTYEGVWKSAIREGDRVSLVNRSLVSGNFFDMLGARPILGRALQPSDDVLGAAPVVVLSYGAWQRRFGGNPNVIGQRILSHDDGVSMTIVGVMPRGLDYPKGTDMWTAMFASVPEKTVPHMSLYIIGRLAAGSSERAVLEELTAFYQRMPTMERVFRGAGQSFPQAVIGDTRPAVFAFSAAAGLLLLITCINVANLLLVRGLARVREMAVRAALGGSPATLVSQLLIENALLAFMGGVIGLALGAAVLRVFIAFAPNGLPRLEEISLDATTVAVAVGITSFAMLLFALAPAVLTSRVDAQEALRSGGRHRSRRSRRMTEVLVGGQVALAMVVLSGAGLIARSLVALERADLAFDPSKIVVAELSWRYDQYDDVANQRALLERVLPRIVAVPSVRSASPVVAAPYSGAGGWDALFTAEGQSEAQVAANPMVDMGVVSPEYFETFGLRPLRGRVFTRDDREGSTPVVVISESVARHYWPGADPIGKRFQLDSMRRLQVIGVVPDMRYRDLRVARASVYYPLTQSQFPFVPNVVAIRTSGDPSTILSAVRAAVADADPGVAVSSIAPFEEFLTKPLAQPRMNALLLSVFAVAALVLCAVGLLGVMMTLVHQRMRELGIRIAVGATPSALRGMVLQRGLAIALAGFVAGLAGSLGLNRFLGAMLYDVSATDAATLFVAGATLLSVAAIASAIPAQTAARIDPVIALRAD